MVNDRHTRSGHQEMLYAMLEDLDRVCRAHGIRYQLFAGTLLGAVRHKGFIPWDDDLDIVMLRPEYERFFEEAAPDLDPEKYYVQREFSEHWPMQFSKLRRNGTACLEKYHPKDAGQHQGVYIDIFPCDPLAENPVVRNLQFLAAKVVIAKALDTRGYETGSLLKKGFMAFCRLLPREPFLRFAVRRKDEASRLVHTFFGAARTYRKNVFERKWLTESVMLPFEEGKYPVPAHYDKMLHRMYGDYRILPDPQKRKMKEHTVLVDLAHSYTEYLGRQQAMKFSDFTRSIR